MPELDGPTGEELRERYAGQAETADTALVLRMLAESDTGKLYVIADRYASLEAFEAFARGNKRHHGHETLGPVTGADGAVYGLTILNRPVGDYERQERAARDGRPVADSG